MKEEERGLRREGEEGRSKRRKEGKRRAYNNISIERERYRTHYTCEERTGSSLILLLSHVSPIRTLDSSSTGIMRVRIKRLITGSNGTPKAP